MLYEVSKHSTHRNSRVMRAKTCIERIYCISMSQPYPLCRNGLKREGWTLFFSIMKEKTTEMRINMRDNMLSDILVWLLLYNIVADKHILLSCFYFCQRNKMFWRCILFWCTQLSSVLSFLTLLLAKAGAYYGLFQTTDAPGLATPLRKL